MRPAPDRLLPGVRVLRRDAGRLQVGLDPAGAVVLDDTDAVRRTLAALTASGPDDDLDPSVLHRLRPLVAPPAVTGSVLLLAFGATDVPEARPLLEGSGLAVVDPVRGDAPHVGLLAGAGEPDRGLLDDWVRDDLPHLLVRFADGAALVGPFVVPGRTPCLRCIDAHRTDRDPRWPLLVAQHATADEAGPPVPVDPALRTLALAWAVRDLLTHRAGGRPASEGVTLRLPADLVGAEAVRWRRHPECGCTWNQPEARPQVW